MLRVGEFQRCERWRYESGVFEAPYPVTALTPSVPSGLSGTITALGMESVMLNGTMYLVCAFHSTGTTDGRIYKVNVSTGAYTELTAGSGKYGNTRLSNSTNKVSFLVVQDVVFDYQNAISTGWRPQRKDYLVIQNGTDLPRIYDEANNIVAIHRQITPPASNSPSLEIRPSFLTYWATGTKQGSSPTFTNSGGGLSFALFGTSPEDNTRLTITSAAATGDWAKIDENGTTPGISSLASSKYLMFAYRTSYIPIWDCIKIEVSEDNVTYYTIYDPTSITSSQRSGPYYGSDDVTNFIAFDTTHLTETTLTTLDQVRYFKFTLVVAPGTGSNITLDIYNLVASGNETGGREFKISWFNSGSRAESKGFYCGLDKIKLPKTGDYGASLGGCTWPFEVGIGYSYKVGIENSSSAERDLGTDTVRIYVRDEGETEFSMWYEYLQSSYSGSWSFTSGSEYTFGFLQIGDGPFAGLVARKDPSQLAPDALSTIMPIASAMTFANGRAFLGDVTDGNNRSRGDVWISEYKNAFRFRRAVEFITETQADPRSATVLSFPGQQVRGFGKTPANVLGGDSIWIFTDSEGYVVDGFDAISLSRPVPIGKHGTPAGRSVAVKNSVIFWLDQERQIRVMAPGGVGDAPSRNTIEDKLAAIAVLGDVCSAYFQERYLLAYAPTGANTNTRLLGFSDRYGFFEFDEPLPSPCRAQAMTVYNDAGSLKLFMQSTDGKIYWYGDTGATQDFGTTNLSPRLTTGDYHNEMWGQIGMTDVGVIMDDVASAAVTTVRTAKPAGSTSTGTLDVDVSTNQTWRWDSLASSPSLGRAGVRGAAISLDLQFSTPAGVKLYSIRAKVEGLEAGADVDPG